jgi:hypothetical protein
MIQVGKKYEVIEPISAEMLGLPPYVRILKEADGMFFGDNDTWYLPDGRNRISIPLISDNVISLGREIIE